jgi:CTP synthase (UTP-ammonia lyase)
MGGKMAAVIRIGLIGEYDAAVPAHQAIPVAFKLAGQALASTVELEWVPTDQITNPARVAKFDGLWCVPTSPYRSMEGALLAIAFARADSRIKCNTLRKVLPWKEHTSIFRLRSAPSFY